MGIAVLDIGTSSMRGILYGDDGEKLFTRQITYSPMYPEPDRVEQNPRDWKDAMESAMAACVGFAGQRGEEIRAISITSQRSSVIPVGADDQPLGNAIMWQDRRVLGVLEELEPYGEKVFALTGSRPNPVFSGPKMSWIRTCCPELYERSRRLVVIPDYIIHEMTGEWVTDATYGSRSLLMNLRNRQWDDELLKLFRLEKEKLCRLIEPGSIAGQVNRSCALKTGLAEGIPVISAGGDQQCAALGMGIIRHGRIEISAGTGAYLIAAADSVPEHLKDDVICNASAVPGAYVLESSILSCASAFNWWLKLGYGMNEDNRQQVYQIVNAELNEALKKPDGPVVLPLFQGRGTPDWNSSSRGSFHYLNLGTSRGDIAKAVLEGLCYEISINIDIIRQYVGDDGGLHACGGLVNSAVFCRILAGVLGDRIYTYQDNEAAAAGAWISAGVTLGLYPDYETAFNRSRRGQEGRETVADEALYRRYQEGKKEYAGLYRQLYQMHG